MASIGERLREARMRQRVDLNEVERVTKIRAKYLGALENDEFDVLPGPTFVRSFLKTYADYLGLDARLLIEEYRVHHETVPEEEATHFSTSAPRSQERRRERRPIGAGWLIGGGAALLVIALLVIGLLAGGGGGGSNRGSTNSAPQKQPTTPGRGARGHGRPARRRTVTVKITPHEPTFVCVDSGPGTRVFEGTLTSPRTFRGKRLRLNLGRTSAGVRVNGRRVAVGTGANPVGFLFTPNARPKPLPLGARPCA